MAAPSSARQFLRAATTARMLLALLLVGVAAFVCVQLGSWQWERSVERGAAGARAKQEQMLAADPRPLSDVLAPQREFRAEHLGAKVTARGHYGDQVLIPGRQVGGEPATLVVADFTIADGPDAGAHLPVLRGWVGPDVAGVKGGAAYGLDALAVPAGEQEVAGYLANSEQDTSASDVPGALNSLSTAQLAGRWGTPTYTGYLVAADGGPAPLLDHLAPPPDLVRDSGRNLQNLGYAVEWFVFGGFALALWVKMVRDEAQHRAPTRTGQPA